MCNVYQFDSTLCITCSQSIINVNAHFSKDERDMGKEKEKFFITEKVYFPCLCETPRSQCPSMWNVDENIQLCLFLSSSKLLTSKTSGEKENFK